MSNKVRSVIQFLANHMLTYPSSQRMYPSPHCQLQKPCLTTRKLLIADPNRSYKASKRRSIGGAEGNRRVQEAERGRVQAVRSRGIFSRIFLMTVPGTIAHWRNNLRMQRGCRQADVICDLCSTRAVTRRLKKKRTRKPR